MFGYLFPTKEMLTLDQRKIFRDYYCSICISHKYRYGFPSIFLNNYDLAIFAIILNIYNDHISDCGNCGKRIENKKEKFSSTKWLELVDFNVNLVRKKLDDDFLDHPTTKAIIFKATTFPIFLQSKHKNSDLYSTFDKEYAIFRKTEEQKPDLEEMIKAYDIFIYNTFSRISYAKSPHIELLIALNRWIFCIDAVDDFDDDLKYACYNPYVTYSGTSSKIEFLANYKYNLSEEYNDLHSGILDAYRKCSYPRKNRIILDNIIYQTLPKVTSVILNNGKLDKKRRLL